jgi:hypothetical protein
MGTVERSAGVAIMTLLLGLGTAATAWAARFEPRGPDVARPELQAQSPGTENPSIQPFVTGGASVTDTLIDIRIGVGITVNCTFPGCNGNDIVPFLQMESAQIMPEDGEQVGDPVLLCLRSSYRLGAAASAGFTASATAGGDPITDPTRVVRTPGNISVFSDGPHTVTQGNTASDHFTVPFQARVGDFLNAEVGVQVETMGTGIGTASASAENNVVITIGPCTAPAPVASRTGLMALAALLGSAGALTLRRRRT